MRPLVVGIGGSQRPGSSTEAALRYALAEAERCGARTTLFGGGDLAALPIYAVDGTPPAAAALRLLDDLRQAEGVIVATPAYHGAVSGAVKNALDYLEELREGERCYLDGLAVGCIATGAGWQAVVASLQQLRSIAHALRGWPTPLGAAINTVTQPFSAAGDPLDEQAAFQLRTVGRDVVAFATRAPAALGGAATGLQ